MLNQKEEQKNIRWSQSYRGTYTKNDLLSLIAQKETRISEVRQQLGKLEAERDQARRALTDWDHLPTSR